MSRVTLLSNAGILLAALSVSAAVQAELAPFGSSMADFAVGKTTTVPGQTLKPGSYSLHVIDHIRDRYVLRLDDGDGKPLSTFVGLQDPAFAPAPEHGLILWASAPKGTAAVRGFVFRDGNTLEFVYPKLQAVAIAKVNDKAVLAVDPESEGRKPDPKLSIEDREVVTLWQLKATRVGTAAGTAPAIEAERYVSSTGSSTGVAQTGARMVASAEPPPQIPDRYSPGVQTAPVRSGASRPAPFQSAVARAETPSPLAPTTRLHPALKSLPKTASDLPSLLLLSIVMLVVAGGLSFLRRQLA